MLGQQCSSEPLAIPAQTCKRVHTSHETSSLRARPGWEKGNCGCRYTVPRALHGDRRFSRRFDISAQSILLEEIAPILSSRQHCAKEQTEVVQLPVVPQLRPALNPPAGESGPQLPPRTRAWDGLVIFLCLLGLQEAFASAAASPMTEVRESKRGGSSNVTSSPPCATGFCVRADRLVFRKCAISARRCAHSRVCRVEKWQTGRPSKHDPGVSGEFAGGGAPGA